MLKRIIVLMCVLVVCLVCAVPAFAVGGVGSQYLYYSNIPIDVIRLNDGSQKGFFMDWPFDVVSEKTAYVASGPILANVYSSSAIPYNDIYGDFSVGDATSLTLISNLSYYNHGAEFKLSYYDEPSDLTFTRVRVEFDLVDFVEDTNTGLYHPVYTHYKFDSDEGGLDDPHEIDIVAYLKKTLFWQAGISPNYATPRLYQGLKITVDFNFASDPDVTRLIAVELNADNLPHESVMTWFENLNVRNMSPISDFNPLGWLVNVLDGFLSFEIFPGFSINVILHLIMVVTLLLWFMRIIS